MISLLSSLIYLWIDIVRGWYKTGTESTWITDLNKNDNNSLFLAVE